MLQKMYTIHKVGIYKDTTNPKYDHILIVRTYHNGTFYFPFDSNVFIEGWFLPAPEPSRPSLVSRLSPYLRHNGYPTAFYRRYQSQPSPLLLQAIQEFKITPTSLRHTSQTSQRRVKWFTRRTR